MRKITWTALLALLLAAMLSSAALAAQGDANIALQEQISEDYDDYIMSSCVAGGALYLCGNTHIFVYRPGDTDVTAVEYQPPELAEDERWYLARLLSDGDALYALTSVMKIGEESSDVERVELVPVEIDGDKVNFGSPLACSAEDLIVSYGGDRSDMIQINDACCVGGYAMLFCYDESGMEHIYALDLESGEGNFLEDVGESIVCMTPYEDGQLLIETYDYGDHITEFWVYNPEDESISSVGSITTAEDDYQMPNGLAWSAESGKLFYLADGYVMAAEDFDFENAQIVAELSTFYGNQSAGLLLPGDLYVYVTFEGVMIRSTDPNALPESRLVIRNNAWAQATMDAYYAFGNSHPDVAVVIDDGYSSTTELVESMMNQDDSVDIYTLSVDSGAFDAVYNRGYMVELDDERLTSAISEMYPAIQDALTRDGSVIAVPLSVYSWIPGLNYEGFEKIGIPREQVPDNWTELMELLPELPDKLPEDGSVTIFGEYATQEDVRDQLFNAILTAWRTQLFAEGGDPHYSDPELVNALELASTLDLAALGLPEGDDEAEAAAYSWIGGTGDNRPCQLIVFSVGCTLGNFYNNDAEPALLSVAPGGETGLPLSMTVAFVNPFSKNVDLAQEFLVEMMNCLDETVTYNLSDKYAEPVHNQTMLASIEDARETLESMKAQLEVAEDVDKPALEEEIANQEAYIADMEKNSWKISQEDIEQFRAMDDKLLVSRYDFLNGADDDGELADLTQQFLDGKVSAADFLKEVDRKVRMRAMEGN